MESAGAGIPLNPGVAGVNKDVAIPPESPEIGARSMYIAGRLLAGASTFFFLAFLFAFFYLRSLNENHMWQPADVKPEQALGAVSRNVRRLREFRSRRACATRRPRILAGKMLDLRMRRQRWRSRRERH